MDSVFTEEIQRAWSDLDAVYAAGKAIGGGTGDSYDIGFDAGQLVEYDRFWDTYQQNGNRTVYSYAFSGEGWTTETFRPKYDIVPAGATGAMSMFRTNTNHIDLSQHINALGIKLDFSQTTDLEGVFYGSRFTRIPEVNATSSTHASTAFGNCLTLVTIDKLILKDDGSQTFTNSFNNCNALKNITIEGVIGKSINFNWSPLTPESMASILTHLVDHFTVETGEGFLHTVKFNEACWEALEASDLRPEYLGCDTWKEYTQVKGWLY